MKLTLSKKNSFIYSFSLTLHEKMKFSLLDFFSKCDQICSFLRTWSHLPKKSLMENSTFYAALTQVVLENTRLSVVFK